MKKSLFLLFALLLPLSGCNHLPSDGTPIGEIVRSPGRFEAEPVKVRGEVVTISKIPLISYNFV